MRKLELHSQGAVRSKTYANDKEHSCEESTGHGAQDIEKRTRHRSNEQ